MCKQDVVNAKNYLHEGELLALNDRNILDHAGKISHELAKQLAEQAYEEFNQQRLLNNAKLADERDFEQLTKLIDKKG